MRQLITAGLVFSFAIAHVDAFANPPRLDELGGSRQPCASLEQMPAICNFQGGVASGRNVASITALTLPPLSQGGEALRLAIDGQDVVAEWSRWLPYEIQRGAAVDGVSVSTQLRLPFEDLGVFLQVTLSNETATPRAIAVTLADVPFVRRFDKTWEWGTPRPDPKADDFTVELDASGRLVVADRQSKAAMALAFDRCPDSVDVKNGARLGWSFAIAPGETVTLRTVLALSSDTTVASAMAGDWQAGFDAWFEVAQTRWQARFDAMFTPNNGHFSGWIPELKTDDASLRRIYYSSILSWLSLERTGFPGPFPRVFVTASPYYAPTLTYFWDTIGYATLWTLLDPEQVKAQLRLFLRTDIHICYAIDFLTGKGVGPWYSANDYSVFHLMLTYLKLTGDRAFLDEAMGEGTVLDALDAIALHWKSLVKNPGELADYGTKDNLLETVPTYTNQVPSFNAANVWMMRELGQIYAARGEGGRAAELQAEANSLAQAVLRLYDASNGWWFCRTPDGQMVPVRSVVDFLMVGSGMTLDLPEAVRVDMMDVVERELYAGTWWRALSREDPSAKASLAAPETMATLQASWPGNSLRADHGFTGSYGAWPALAIETFKLLGRPHRAVEMLRDVAPVLDEGPFGQSNYVATDGRPSRKAFRGGQDYFEGCGGAFAEVMLRWYLDGSSAKEAGNGAGDEWSFVNPPPALQSKEHSGGR